MLEQVREVLSSALHLGPRGLRLTAQSELLGQLPELDSMAVVTLVQALEQRFGFVIDDDEISADLFSTLGTLTAFVQRKAAATAAQDRA
ncbi:MAG TPA: acyl carrier protein [Steroidobacteraceae bacterium]|nr:acyl carrier protein [Steroidobacteraceae bacterium]